MLDKLRQNKHKLLLVVICGMKLYFNDIGLSISWFSRLNLCAICQMLVLYRSLVKLLLNKHV